MKRKMVGRDMGTWLGFDLFLTNVRGLIVFLFLCGCLLNFSDLMSLGMMEHMVCACGLWIGSSDFCSTLDRGVDIGQLG